MSKAALVMSCPVDGSMSNESSIVASQGVGQHVAFAVGGRDRRSDVDARRRVLGDRASAAPGCEHRRSVVRGCDVVREDRVVRREQPPGNHGEASALSKARVMTGMYCLIDSPIWTLNEEVPALPPTRVSSLPPEMPYSIRLPLYPHIMSIEIRVSYPAIAPCLSPPSPPPTSSNLTITAGNATKCDKMRQIPRCSASHPS